MVSQRFWLLKSEPKNFSIVDLALAKNQATLWDGVRNYQASNTLRDVMKVGDLGFFYHSSCPTPGIAGIVKITRTGIPDPTAFDEHSPYFDPKSSLENPRWITVEVKLLEKFSCLLPLSEIKQRKDLKGFTLLRPGNRLSVFAVSHQEWDILNSLIHRKHHANTK